MRNAPDTYSPEFDGIDACEDARGYGDDIRRLQAEGFETFCGDWLDYMEANESNFAS